VRAKVCDYCRSKYDDTPATEGLQAAGAAGQVENPMPYSAGAGGASVAIDGRSSIRTSSTSARIETASAAA
jgi:hypothetical protein